MEQIDIEDAVAELETRVDRLRSLYEQYFMGIEKMEPLVPKKDVERRFQTMRREQIRNTALRFRFHMVLQKYNTYQSYWMRIMRQIEDGTYKRDVLRAKANLADRRSTPPAKEKEKGKENESATNGPVDPLVFDAPTRKVDVPSIGLSDPPPNSIPISVDFDPTEEATTNLISRPELPVDEDPTGILPLIGTTPTRARPVADPEKMRQLAARIKAGKPDEAKKEGAPIIATAKPAPPAMAPATAAKRPPPPPLPQAKGKPLAPPITAPKAPLPKPQEKPPEKSPERAAPKAPNPADLSDTRVRQLYTQYVDTKRKQNESTASITYEGVAKSLRESTARLREKHTGNSVDFEVTVKDGKTILRPVLKKKDAKPEKT